MRAATRTRLTISITLSRDMVEDVRKYQREEGFPSLSATVEHLIWRHFLDSRTKDYYLSLTDEERAEQEAWAAFATKQALTIFSRD